MSVIVVLVTCSLTVAALFAGAFLWSVKSGQFDDLDSSSVRMLINDPEKKSKSKS
jgi:cbb3-type cytochrome oxidase maturation protein